MDYYGIIYSAKNLTNNKRYIGQTTCTLEKRKREHINSISQQKYIFQRAMKKYGAENFIWEELDYADSPEELDYKETYWIDHFGTYGNNGYNMTVGGQKIHKPSKEEHIEYLRTQHDDRNLLVFDKLGNFIEESDNRFLFCIENNITTSDANQSLTNRRPSVGDFILIYKDDFTKENLDNRLKRVRNTREFVVFNENNKYIGTWYNQTYCSRDTKAHRGNISRCLAGTLNKTHGYYFYYLDNCPEELKHLISTASLTN